MQSKFRLFLSCQLIYSQISLFMKYYVRYNFLILKILQLFLFPDGVLIIYVHFIFLQQKSEFSETGGHTFETTPSVERLATRT